MQVEGFLRLLQELTGTPCKGVADGDKQCLVAILKDDQRAIDWSQFNELLLLANKDRVQSPFFSFFFGPKCTVGTIRRGVKQFQKSAMLLFGNFIFAYRRLSRIKQQAAFMLELKEVGAVQRDSVSQYTERARKLVEARHIGRGDTPLVGYLLAPRIVADAERCRLFHGAFEGLPDGSNWKYLADRLRALARPSEHSPLMAIIDGFRRQKPRASLGDFRDFVAESLPQIERREKRLAEVQRAATRNQDIYLTWNHMDVYFATSMRSVWEFQDLYDFIDRLMGQQELKNLKLRYFDPTQSYTSNPINKGLVESLMLKRAKCTVYSVQDVDTLGKDSELAATLAQGKPVIAYAPHVDVRRRAAELVCQDAEAVLERVELVRYADETARGEIKVEKGGPADFLSTCEKACLWRSLPSEKLLGHLCPSCLKQLRDLCAAIARAEKRIYDKRADTLRRRHPLAVQVNLSNGVATGVLVVRGVKECAKLLRSVLTNDMQLDVEEDDDMWYLREKISVCVYRVVTKNPRITNCFWNFYLQQREGASDYTS